MKLKVFLLFFVIIISSSAYAENKDAVTKEAKVISTNGIYFKDVNSLKPVKKLLDNASKALDIKPKEVDNDYISEAVSSIAGASAGGAVSGVALYSLGVTGFSGAGITSGLAAAGTLIGGGMLSGLVVLAVPVVAGGVIANWAVNKYNNHRLIETKTALYKEALLKHEEIIKALEKSSQESNEQIKLLEAINQELRQVIEKLKSDINLINA